MLGLLIRRPVTIAPRKYKIIDEQFWGTVCGGHCHPPTFQSHSMSLEWRSDYFPHPQEMIRCIEMKADTIEKKKRHKSRLTMNIRSETGQVGGRYRYHILYCHHTIRSLLPK